MVFSLVTRVFNTSSEPPTIEDWDASRVKDLGIRASDDLEYEPVVEAVNGAHWLAVLCYIEKIEPDTLALEPALLAQVKLELCRFEQLDALQVYAASIERLSEGEDCEEDDEDEEEYSEDGDDAVAP